MITTILKVNPQKPETSKIKLAAQILQKGGLVAFPTETVYGLGADIFNSAAVKKIFKVKGRPFDNPLIVHIARKSDLPLVAMTIPSKAKKLINKFWPGPLTLILKKKKNVPHEVTSGLPNVACRMPANRVALALIKTLDSPIAAPSANLAGRPSPTDAKDVYNDLKNKISIILDGGKTKIGLESTVLNCTTSPPTLLRPGAITPKQIKKVIGKIKIHPAAFAVQQFEESPPSPGLKYKHYAPKARLILVEGKPSDIQEKIAALAQKFRAKKKMVGIITTQKRYRYKDDTIFFVGATATAYARNLFKTLRECDKKKIDVILAEGIPPKNLGLAIMNRLRKAASKIIKT